jgi:hypothetical protein
MWSPARSSFCRAVLVVLAITATRSSAVASTIVPDGLGNVEGNANNGYPFNLLAHSLASQRYQQVYDASAFDTMILIDGILFRPDNLSGAAFSSTLGSIQIDLSTTSRAVDALSATFAANVGGDNTTVFNGALSLSSGNAGPLAGPRFFDVFVPFTTPFLYDPSVGNLLLDIRNFSGGLTTQFDASDVVGDSISRVFSQDVNATTGELDDEFHSMGLVTAFHTADPVPEPASVVLLGSALAAGAARHRRNRR